MNAIDWSKPVQRINSPVYPVRVLCTDAPGDQPVVVMYSGGAIERVTKDGCLFVGYPPRFENVPPPKEKETRVIFLQRRADGSLRVVCARPENIQNSGNTGTWTTIARRVITITEGEGL